MLETPETLNTQAIELASNGEFREAIACLKKALGMQKYNTLLWFNLGVTYRDAGETDLAKEALLMAFEINDDDIDIIEMLASLYLSTGDYQQAAKFADIGTSKFPENARIWNTSGVIAFNVKAYDIASVAFERAVSINPYYYDALYNLRDTYEELGNKKGADICRQQMKHLSTGSHS